MTKEDENGPKRPHYDQPVEIRSAFAFFCHDCGEENFLIPPPLLLTEDEERDIVEELGADFENYCLARFPEKVECTACGAEFEVENPEGPL